MIRFFITGLSLLLGLSVFAFAAGLTVHLVSITSPVPPGGRVILIVTTEPGAACIGQRQGHSGDELSLQSSIAGSSGQVQWSWPIRSGLHPVGVRSVRVICTKANRQGSLSTAFDAR
jgi:hypothetical protein